MFKLDDFKVDRLIQSLGEDDLKFLNLSGRKAFHSQGFFGEGEIVAIVDTGVNPHPEFEDRLLKGKNFCNYRSSRDTSDDNGHGTHVAGSVAGKNVGIGPKVKILPVKVLSGDGSGKWDDVIDALNWIREYRHNGKKVTCVSMSLSSHRKGEKLQDIQDLEEAINNLVLNDIAVIVSVGNTGDIEDRVPASFDEVICVGAVDVDKELASFATQGNHVDVTQIGVGVISAWYKGGYAALNGTSMSTPIVSGIYALLADKYRNVFGDEISENFLWKMLKYNTKDLGIKGADKEYGTGFCTLQPMELKLVMGDGRKEVLCNGEIDTLDVPAQIIPPGRFVLPSRYTLEKVGSYTKFNPETMEATMIL